MAAAVAGLAAKPAHADRDCHCPACRRFLAERRCYVALAGQGAWLRLRCHGCRRWWWVDSATGEVASAPRRPVTAT
jgi:ribosomal protein S27E